MTPAQLATMDHTQRARLFTETAQACYPNQPWRDIAAELCVNVSTLHRWKNGDPDPSLAILYMLEIMRGREHAAIVAQLGAAVRGALTALPGAAPGQPDTD